MPDEVIQPSNTSNNSLTPALSYIGNKIRVKFARRFLKQGKLTYTHKTIVNIYIIYEILVSTRGYDDCPTLENYFFSRVKLTKNSDIDK